MIKRLLPNLILLLSFFALLPLRGQQANTLYYLKNVPVRNQQNPAFQALPDFYLSLPAIGKLYVEAGVNSIALRDLIMNSPSGTPITFLHPDGNKSLFMHSLLKNNRVAANVDVNLLSFGFRNEQNYWSLISKLKGDLELTLPKDLFQLALEGTPDIDENRFNLKNLEADAALYAEIGISYARKLNDQLSIGTSIKYLHGLLSASNHNQSLSLNAGVEQWSLNGNGILNVANPIITNYNTFERTPIQLKSFLQPAGKGAAIDLGATYQPTERLQLSASLMDLGFIRWTKNAFNLTYSVNDFSFNGVSSINANNFEQEAKRLNLQSVGDSLLLAFKQTQQLESTQQSFITSTHARLNLGAEYDLWKEKMSIGLLSRTYFAHTIVREEMTASLNFFPTSWFNAAVSYSLFDGGWGSLGAGIGLRTGFIQWFAASDFIPLHTTSPFPTKLIPIPLPYSMQQLNFTFGMQLVLDAPDPSTKVRWSGNKTKANYLKTNRNGLHLKKSKRKECNCM